MIAAKIWKSYMMIFSWLYITMVVGNF